MKPGVITDGLKVKVSQEYYERPGAELEVVDMVPELEEIAKGWSAECKLETALKFESWAAQLRYSASAMRRRAQCGN